MRNHCNLQPLRNPCTHTLLFWACACMHACWNQLHVATVAHLTKPYALLRHCVFACVSVKVRGCLLAVVAAHVICRFLHFCISTVSMSTFCIAIYASCKIHPDF